MRQRQKHPNNLKNRLRDRLKGARRTAVLGVGSELRGDDAAGMLVAVELEKWRGGGGSGGGFAVFFGGSAPENITGQIKKFAPTHLIIIDALDSGSQPGDVELIEPGEIGGASFGTHGLPLKMVIEYLKHFIECEIIVIGIKTASLGLGESVSREVKKSVAYVSSAIKEILVCQGSGFRGQGSGKSFTVPCTPPPVP